MKINYIPAIIIAWLIISISEGFGQNAFYDLNSIQEISIIFTQANWDYQMDTAKNGQEGYIIASQVTINGIAFDSVGVKYKGNSSYSANRVKNPLHIQLDYIKSTQSYMGYTDIKLSNGWSDPSSIREALSFKILRNYMDAPESNFARISINGSYFGFYTNTESIDKDFAGKHFYSSGNTLVKCNPLTVGNYLPNLDYLGTDSSLYYNRYELKSDYAWKDLLDLCDSLENNASNIHKNLDVDRALWMLAFNNVTVNLDSYSGSFAQNYYLYRDDNGRFNPVIWDLNMNFGGFPNTGIGGPLNLSGMQTMIPLLHATNTARPLIKQLLSDPTYRNMYIAHMRTITAEFFSNNTYQTDVTNFRVLIDSSILADPNGLYTYSQFQQSLTTNIGSGPFQIPGIYNLMTGRSGYLNATSEFQQIHPIISSINVSPAIPAFNDTIWITCQVTNSNSVKLGYRFFTPAIFSRILMYDDGIHHDGGSGDGVFGAAIIANSALIEYYIYAENTNAGMFSPERAEHEFYSIPVNIPIAAAGDLTLNEFMAINQTGVTDLEGNHEDWIELFNKTGLPVGLFGLYLSDDALNLTKWPFPINAILPPNGYAVVWADEDSSSVEMHANFKLSGNGEKLFLSTVNGLILDSITFGPQFPDVAMARCPDGTGIFAPTYQPTFLYSNLCTNGLPELSADLQYLKIYPNPSNGNFTVQCTEPINRIVLINTLGVETVLSSGTGSNLYSFQLSELKKGIYILKINGTLYSKIILQ